MSFEASNYAYIPHIDRMDVFRSQGVNLSSPWYGFVPFFRVPFYDGLQIYERRFPQFFTFPDLWLWFLCKNSLLVNFMGISGFMGMIFRSFPNLWIYFSEISPDLWVVILRFECHNPYLGDSSDPPPGFPMLHIMLIFLTFIE